MSLIREVPAYRSFVVARVVAWSGNALSLVALPVAVYQLTGSATLTGLLAATGALPYLVLGLPVGALVDRWDPRRTLASWSLVPGLGMLTVPAADAAGVLTTLHLFTVALLAAVAFVFADAASFGALPLLVGRERLGEATATLSAASTVIGIAGPGVAGVLVATIGPSWVLGADGVGYVLAAVVLARTALPARPARTGGDGAAPRRLEGLGADMAEGLRWLWAHRVVRTLTVVGAGNSVTGGAVGGLVVVIGVERLGLAADDERLGLLFAAAAVGSLVGSLLLTRLQRVVAVGRLTAAGLALMAVIVLALAAATQWVVGALLLLAFHLCSTLVILNGIVVRQRVTPMRLQSRVNTTARMIAWGGSPLGAAAGGVLAGAWGVDVALRVCVAGVVAALGVGLAAGIVAIGRLDDLAPDPDEGPKVTVR